MGSNANTSSIIFQQAHNAGQIAQQLFYLFVEQTWTYDMKSIYILQNRENSKKIDEIVILAGDGAIDGPGSASTLPRTGGNWLIKFPHEAFTIRNSDAKLVILADGNSQWAFSFMHMAIRKLFAHLVNNVDEDIREVTYYEKHGGTQHIVMHYDRYPGCDGFVDYKRYDQLYNDDRSHGIYEITLKSGDKIALDLAGAQYRFAHESVVLRSDYWARHEDTRTRTPLRTHYQNHIKLMRTVKHLSAHSLILDLMTEFSLILDGAGITNTKRIVPQLSLLPLEPNVETFNKLSSLLIRHVRRKMQRRVKLHNKGWPCPGFPDGMCHPSFRWRELVLPSVDFADVDWKDAKWILASPETSYISKTIAREMLSFQYAVKTKADVCGKERISFLNLDVPGFERNKNVSTNPFWKGKK